MGFIKRLGKFWIIIITAGACGYVFLENQDVIALTVPHVGTLEEPAYLVYGAFFLIGCGVASFYFAVDAVGKAFVMRRLRRRITELESRSAGSA